MTREKREHSRHTINIPVQLHEGEQVEHMLTSNVSRNGAFLWTDLPCEEDQLLQLTFQPTGRPNVSVLARVVRRMPPEAHPPTQRGVGVEFFALHQKAREHWNSFVDKLEGGDQLQLDESPLIDTDPSFDLPTKREHPRYRVCFMVRFPNEEQLTTFSTYDISLGGIFLETPYLRQQGERIDLILLHPQTEEPFSIEGVVAYTENEAADGKDVGMGICFAPLEGERQKLLEDFIITGVSFLNPPEQDRGTTLEKLRRAVALSPHTPHFYLKLGESLLQGTSKREELLEAIRAFETAMERGAELIRAMDGLEEAKKRLDNLNNTPSPPSLPPVVI